MAKKTARSARAHAKTARQPSRKAKAGRFKRRNGSSARPATAQRQRTQLTPGPSGIDKLLEFFSDAGIEAQFGPDRHLQIDGRDLGPFTPLPYPDTDEWVTVANMIALRHVRARFISSVEENVRLGADLGASLLPRDKGVAIMRGDERLAVIHPVSASISGRHRLIYANFLAAGPHWRKFADALRRQASGGHAGARGAGTKLAAGRKRQLKAAAAGSNAQLRRIDRLPDYLGPDLIRACHDASRRIRLERQLDYGDTPVVLESDAGDLTFLPITGRGSLLVVPFRLSSGTGTLDGELVLGNRDPLPVQVGRNVAEKDAASAWTCALLGFADATCIALDSAGQSVRREPARARLRPRSLAPRTRPSMQALPRRRRWPSYLEPVGHTAHYLNSLVAGHRRRLPNGRKASDEARDRARRIGIFLNSHETWVQSHVRGLPEGIEMRFLWHAPTELKLSR